MTDRELFEKNKSNWCVKHDGWPQPSSIKESLQTSLESHGVFLLKSAAIEESHSLKNKLKNYLGHLGDLVNQAPEGCDLFEVKNEGYEQSHPKFRGPSSNRQLSFHTDRCDIIAFYCVRAAHSGGLNQFIKAKTLYKILAEEEPELLECLEKPFNYKRHNADPGNPNKFYKLPVFDKVDNKVFVTIMSYLIEKAAQDPLLPELTAIQKKALNKLQEVCQRPENQLEIKLEAGDLLFLDNTQMLHSRSAFTDNNKQRLYYRAWLAVPWSPKLPDSFKVLFGNTDAGSLRGGFKLLN